MKQSYIVPQMEIVDLYEEYDLMEAVSATDNPLPGEGLGSQKRRGNLWENQEETK